MVIIVLGEYKNYLYMMYISIFMVLIKKVNNFNKTRLNISKMLNPNFALLNLSYVNLCSQIFLLQIKI